MARGGIYVFLAVAFAAVTLFAVPGFAQVQAGGVRATEIRVEGAQRIETETVQTYVTIKAGDPITAEASSLGCRQSSRVAA